MMTYRPDAPEHMDTNPRNPFNDIKPHDANENSLGFYSEEAMYITEMELDASIYNYNGSISSAVMICREQKDTILINSKIVRYPESYYGTLDKYDSYFRQISFLIQPEDYLEDVSILLPGNRVFIKDQNGVVFNAASAIVVFNEELVSECYHSGTFTVEYNDLSGRDCSFERGRFKLFDTVIEEYSTPINARWKGFIK